MLKMLQFDFGNLQDNLRARTIAIISIGFVIITLFFGSGVLVTTVITRNANMVGIGIVSYITAMFSALTYRTLKRGHLQRAALMLISLILFAIAVALIFTPGGAMTWAGISSLTAIGTAAVILKDRRYIFVVAVIAIVVFGTLMILQRTEILRIPPPTGPGIGPYFVMVMGMVLLAVLLIVTRFYHNIQATIAQSEERTQAVKQRAEEMRERLAALRESNLYQENLLKTLQALESPILQIDEHALIVPLVGSIDTGRALAINAALLREIDAIKAQVALIDLTGVPIVDTGVSQHIMKMARSARLLGCRVILTGISSDMAHTLVEMGVGFEDTLTFRTLRDGIEKARRLKLIGA
jgi:anti-anti-sigma regulatory factor